MVGVKASQSLTFGYVLSQGQTTIDQQTTVVVRLWCSTLETTSQDRLLQGMQVNMPAHAEKCLLLNVRVATVLANGTQLAYTNGTGFIGTHQDPATHWAREKDPHETHYYRVTSLYDLISYAKAHNWAKGSAWQLDEATHTAYIVQKIEQQYSASVDGWLDPTWLDVSSKGTQ